MLRVAILEKEDVAKDIMFYMTSSLFSQDFIFRYYTKISQFAHAENEKEFQIIIFHEKFEVPRVTQSFVLNKPQRIVIYTKEKLTKQEKEILPFARILYIDRNHIHAEIERISSAITFVLRNQQEYLFSYNHVKVPLRISDIVYIEKQDKNLIYHTKRGEFKERKSMKDAQVYFEPFQFLWIHASYLVNMQYITQIEKETIILQKLRLPIARARKHTVSKQLHRYVESKK